MVWEENWGNWLTSVHWKNKHPNGSSGRHQPGISWTEKKYIGRPKMWRDMGWLDNIMVWHRTHNFLFHHSQKCVYLVQFVRHRLSFVKIYKCFLLWFHHDLLHQVPSLPCCVACRCLAVLTTHWFDVDTHRWKDRPINKWMDTQPYWQPYCAESMHWLYPFTIHLHTASERASDC